MALESVPGQPTKSAPEDVDFWTRYLVPVFSSLMKSTGSYSEADHNAQIRVLSEHVLPYLGPRPSSDQPGSYLTQTGCPLQPQINFTADKAIVRYCWDLCDPSGNDDVVNVEAPRRILSSLTSAFGFSTRWCDPLLSYFAPTPDEVKDMPAKLPAWLKSFTGAEGEPPTIKRLPFAFVGMDLKGSKVSLKAYFNPKVKEIVTGQSGTEMIWNVLDTFEPPICDSSINVVKQFLDEHPGPSSIELVAVDCVDEANLSDARVKLYVHSMNNSFDTVRDYVTLGGRLQDETTLKGLEVLHDIWHLLLQEPEGVKDDFNKPLNDGTILCQRLYFSVEMRPGRVFPEVKTYLPTWNYVRTDEETVRNYEEVFRKCGYEWGQGGKYRKVFEDAFGPASHNRKKPVHCDASFLYDDKGVYQTVYFSPPLGTE